MDENIYALAIIAHPDDETFLLAGTALKFAEEGKRVAVICATHGEKGADRLNRDLTEQQMAEIRTQELESACAILGCDCMKFFNYTDGSVDQSDFQQLVANLKQEINFYQPAVILTFGEEGISGHRDHITVGLAAIEATKQSEVKPLEVWLASIPASMIDDFGLHIDNRKVHRQHYVKQTLKGVPDQKLLKIDVQKYKQ